MSERATKASEQQIQELVAQLRDPLPHPGAEILRRHSEEVVDWSLEHFLSSDQDLGRSASRAELERLLRRPPPEQGTDFEQVFAEFQRDIAPNTMRVDHPRFLAFVPAAPSYYSILGDWLCASLNCFAGVWMEAAGAAQVELLVLDWLAELAGYPPAAQGILTSGGSEANLTALAVARERLSYEDRNRAVLYQSDQRHYSIDKAAMILGLRPDQIRVLPSDDEFRLRGDKLAQSIAEDRNNGKIPWAVVANAGATNTGLVDPLDELADCCREHRLWLHVDAAYGWAAALTPSGRKLLSGIDRADSITLDPHKWFAQTYDAGCVLVREGRLLYDTFASHPEYLKDVAPTEEEINFSDYGVALTRRFRALKLWLSLKVLGLQWFRKLVERCMKLAELTEALLRQHRQFEILSPRGLSIVCFRFVPEAGKSGERDEEYLNALNLRLLDSLRNTGRFFLTSTLIRGRVALRCCFVNWRTTSADVRDLVTLLTHHAQLIQLEKKSPAN